MLKEEVENAARLINQKKKKKVGVPINSTAAQKSHTQREDKGPQVKTQTEKKEKIEKGNIFWFRFFT